MVKQWNMIQNYHMIGEIVSFDWNGIIELVQLATIYLTHSLNKSFLLLL